MKIGYVRVSTVDQNTARQEVLMTELGVEQVFIDRMSGKNTDRPELKRMLASLPGLEIPSSWRAFLGLPEIRETCWNW